MNDPHGTTSREVDSLQQGDIANAGVATLAKGASVNLLGRSAGRVFHLLGQVTLARLLGPELFGLYAIGWAFIRMINVIGPLGLDKGVIHFGSRYWPTNHGNLKRVIFQSVGLALLIGLLLGLMGLLGAPLMSKVFQKPDLVQVFRWLAIAIPLAIGLRVGAAATRIPQLMKYSTYAEEISQPGMNLLLILLFLLIGWGLSGALIAVVLSYGVAFALAIYYNKITFHETLKARVEVMPLRKDLIAFSLLTALAGTAAILIDWVDRLMVGYFRPNAEVGIYQASVMSSTLFIIFLVAMKSILSPMIANLYHKERMKQLEELYRVSTKWTLYLSLPFFIVICLVPEDLLAGIWGDEYKSGAIVLIILSVAALINVGTGAGDVLLIMTGRQVPMFVISSVSLIASISLNLILIPRLGLPGAAIGTAFAISGFFLAVLFYVRKSLGIWPYDRRYLKGLIAASAALFALLSLRGIDVMSPLYRVILMLIVSLGVFGTTLLLLGLDAEDREFVGMLRKRFG